MSGEQFLPDAETAWISGQAAALGFEACGVAAAEEFPELRHFAEWLERGYAGTMRYLEDGRRRDVRSPLPGARSVIVCALNYNTERPYSTEAHGNAESGRPRGWISRYAWGDDYHQVLWTKLNALVSEMRGHFAQNFEARAYADTGPIHERAAAKHAGLGWLAKNTLLINQSLGSWLFLGVILTSLPLRPTLQASGKAGMPPADRCGSCRRCLDACPTQAIVEPYVLDATRCISYLTIEFRENIPEALREPMGRHIFGCDICQDVCPWNRKSPRTAALEFQPRMAAESETEEVSGLLFAPDLLRIARLSREEFRGVFRGSPVKRSKWQGLIRNACIALGNSGMRADSPAYQETVALLRSHTQSDDAVISESARWAISRIEENGNPSRSSSQAAARRDAPG